MDIKQPKIYSYSSDNITQSNKINDKDANELIEEYLLRKEAESIVNTVINQKKKDYINFK